METHPGQFGHRAADHRHAGRQAAVLLVFGTLLAASAPALSYPEFQAYTEKNSAMRTTDCTMCHVNPNGPMGDGDGQIGSLDEEQLGRLNKARAALAPGVDVDSPILNEFGNQIIKQIGKEKFLELRKKPEGLVAALGDKTDIDQDGIADSREYQDGTDPLNRFHGDPWLLLLHNLDHYRLDVLLAVLAVGATLYGLANFVAGLNVLAEKLRRR